MDQLAHKSQWPSYFQFRVYDYIMVRCIIRFIDTHYTDTPIVTFLEIKLSHGPEIV